MELFEKVLQGKFLFRLTNLKHKEIFSILLYIYTFFLSMKVNLIIALFIMNYHRLLI